MSGRRNSNDRIRRFNPRDIVQKTSEGGYFTVFRNSIQLPSRGRRIFPNPPAARRRTPVSKSPSPANGTCRGAETGFFRHQRPNSIPQVLTASQGSTGYMTMMWSRSPGASRMVSHNGPGFPDAGSSRFVASTQAKAARPQTTGPHRSSSEQHIITKPSPVITMKPQ